jgi:hypothetical protein
LTFRQPAEVPANGRQTKCLVNLFARGHAFFVLTGEERKSAKTDQERDRSAIDATTVPLKVLTRDLETEFRPSVYLENFF